MAGQQAEAKGGTVLRKKKGGWRHRLACKKGGGKVLIVERGEKVSSGKGYPQLRPPSESKKKRGRKKKGGCARRTSTTHSRKKKGEERNSQRVAFNKKKKRVRPAEAHGGKERRTALKHLPACEKGCKSFDNPAGGCSFVISNE